MIIITMLCPSVFFFRTLTKTKIQTTDQVTHQANQSMKKNFMTFILVRSDFWILFFSNNLLIFFTSSSNECCLSH